MRMWLKLVFIVLLAIRATPAAAQFSILNTQTNPATTEQRKLVKPHHPACLTNEQETGHSSVAMRWPLMLPALLTGKQSDTLGWYATNGPIQQASTVPLQAFYRSLLFPAHFFR